MTVAEKLADAQAKYHALLTGVSAREIVDQNGEKVVYTAANRDALKAYIEELTLQNSNVTRAKGPLRVWL